LPDRQQRQILDPNIPATPAWVEKERNSRWVFAWSNLLVSRMDECRRR